DEEAEEGRREYLSTFIDHTFFNGTPDENGTTYTADSLAGKMDAHIENFARGLMGINIEETFRRTEIMAPEHGEPEM
ncbi:MAG: hypothetical protein WAX89_02370, partial [Alphaproteobacteria bacterium]